jgi:ribonucleoside-diphosphate reductase alpha chain
MSNKIGPQTQAADELHAMKYRGRNEDFEESMNRVAYGLSDNGRHYHALREVLLPQRFCPGGRIQGAIGATRQTTAFNCYVSGTIEDTLCDEGGIMDRLKEAAKTSQLGGGIGYDFSTLRPRGYPVKKIESESTGPVSFMEYFNTVGLGVASSGHRRGAQMAILRVDHPDIEEFVRAKQRPGALEGFNISVAVTDAFMEAVACDGLFALRFARSRVREIRALDLWQKIMRSTWDWAEPGVLFIDTVNRMNNLYYCETIAATNPCGEQPLPPYGACLLGSFNLPKYLKPVPREMLLAMDGEVGLHERVSGPDWYFDYDQLKADIAPVVRGMDNVNDRSRYPLQKQYEDAQAKRRMGLGVMGLANAAEALGHAYGSTAFVTFEAKVLTIIRDESYRASAEIAAEKGAFSLFDMERYLDGEFVKTLPDDVRALIRKNGIRNSHLTSIAPTGTISLCADNVSSGIEPVFAYEIERKINTPDGPIKVKVSDYGAGELGVRGKLTADVMAAEHVAVLVTAQRYVDSAVSKTCNVTGDIPWEEFLAIYSNVHEMGGKGCTTFNADGKRTALLVAAKTINEGPSCSIDPMTGARSCE